MTFDVFFLNSRFLERRLNENKIANRTTSGMTSVTSANKKIINYIIVLWYYIAHIKNIIHCGLVQHILQL